MGKALLLLLVACAALYAAVHLGAGERPPAAGSGAPADAHAGARGACKVFIERSQLEAATAEWGDWTAWTITSNDDGTISVGARYAVGTRTRFTTCVLTQAGDGWRLVALSRLQ